jgi:hypothetical protein
MGVAGCDYHKSACWLESVTRTFAGPSPEPSDIEERSVVLTPPKMVLGLARVE